MGINTIPMTKKDKITGLGVRIGCQAFKRCCLNAVSEAKLKSVMMTVIMMNTYFQAFWSVERQETTFANACKRGSKGKIEKDDRNDRQRLQS